MRKHQLHTTLSQKHWELLKKYSDKYDTQQKVLEIALEGLDNNFKKIPALSPEEELWMQFSSNNTACFIQKEGLKMLLDTANIESFEYQIARTKNMEYQIETYYDKPLKDCSLKEIIEGIVINAKMSHWFDEVDYKDEGDFYTIKWAHSLGINSSEITRILMDSVFRTCGTRVETTISEKTVFMKIFKNK